MAQSIQTKFPDSVLYRCAWLRFQSAKVLRTTEQKRQHAQLAQIGLAAGDQQLLIGDTF